MAQKIKITEDQLQRLMINERRRHTYTTEGDTNEQMEIGTNPEMGGQSGVEEGSNLEGKLENFKNKFLEIIKMARDIKNDLPSEHLQELWRDWTINELVSRYGGEDSPYNSQTTATICDVFDEALGKNQEDEDDDYNDEPMNESVQKIKEQFKRFL